MSGGGRSAFLERLRERLTASRYAGPRLRDNGQTLQGLVCPECGDKTAWAYSTEPWAICCNRANKCGARVPTLELFPDLVEHVERSHPPTPADPQAPARAYLEARGLGASLEGLPFEYWPNVRGTGTGAVMFEVAPGVWNGRLFAPPPGEGKTHNRGSTAGLFWQHPGRTYDPAREVFVVEGVLDALSLWELGHQAVAVLAAGQGPARVDLLAFPTLVLAFDADEAGRKALRRWKAAHPGAGAVVPLRGDWNDMLQSGPLEAAREGFERDRPEMEARARLALAESAEEYTETWLEHHGHPPGLFVFGGCYWWATLKPKGAVAVARVSNFTLAVEHYQLDATNPEEPASRFALVVKPKAGGPAVRCSAAAAELSSPNAMRTTLLSRARVLWSGEQAPTNALLKRITEAKAPVVRQLHAVGWDEGSGCYVFKGCLVNPEGRVLRPNKRGFFELGRRRALRPANHPSLTPQDGGPPPAELWRLVYEAWGDRGAAAMAWVVAAWWANQVRARLGFFPFMSLHGDTQTGKSRLTRILNAMQCLDEEGLPMTKANTAKGELRKIAQRSGLFKALLEMNGTDARGPFDLGSLLSLYNAGNPLQTRALKTADNRTREVPFLSALLFVQNREPFTSRAQKERVISLEFRAEHLSPATAAAFNRLVAIPPAQLASFFVAVMASRQEMEAGWEGAHAQAKADLAPAIPDARLCENHAVVLAFHRLLCGLLGVSHDLRPYIEQVGQAKLREVNAGPESPGDYFLGLLAALAPGRGLRGGEAGPWGKVEGGRLYVNLPEAVRQVEAKGYRLGSSIGELQGSLRGHPAFVESGARVWLGEGSGRRQVRCWLFDLARLGQGQDADAAAGEAAGETPPAAVLRPAGPAAQAQAQA